MFGSRWTRNCHPCKVVPNHCLLSPALRWRPHDVASRSLFTSQKFSHERFYSKMKAAFFCLSCSAPHPGFATSAYACLRDGPAKLLNAARSVANNFLFRTAVKLQARSTMECNTQLYCSINENVSPMRYVVWTTVSISDRSYPNQLINATKILHQYLTPR